MIALYDGVYIDNHLFVELPVTFDNFNYIEE